MYKTSISINGKKLNQKQVHCVIKVIIEQIGILEVVKEQFGRSTSLNKKIKLISDIYDLFGSGNRLI